MRSNETDFTKGSPARLILAFFWPLLLTSMLQQFYNFADTWIVGKGLANGFGVLVAQSYGAKEEDIPKLVDVLCNGDGREGSISGFVTLNEEDCTKIYQMMVG